MKQEEFMEKLKGINEKFTKEVYKPLVNLVQEANETDSISWYSISGKKEIADMEDMALLVAWVQDTLSGSPTNPSEKGYNQSVTKKMRKALGYLLP